jgi:proteasome accessory factor C
VPDDDDVTCLIRLSPTARWVTEYYPVSIRSDDPEGTMIEFSASDPSVAAGLLLRLGETATLVEGTEVRAALTELRSAVLRRYSFE